MATLEQAKRSAADLYWLASLLTGSREIAAGVTVEAIAPSDNPDGVFATWMQAWTRKLVIGRALSGVRAELAASARRITFRRAEEPVLPPPSWVLDQRTTKSDLERALLSIDVFPRAAFLLLVFEEVSLEDAAILLNASPDMVRKAHAVGARELTINLARMQGWRCPAINSTRLTSGWDHA